MFSGKLFDYERNIHGDNNLKKINGWSTIGEGNKLQSSENSLCSAAFRGERDGTTERIGAEQRTHGGSYNTESECGQKNSTPFFGGKNDNLQLIPKEKPSNCDLVSSFQFSTSHIHMSNSYPVPTKQ